MWAFVAEHNLPISIRYHLPGLIANVTSDSKVASAAKCARTKNSAIFRNVMGNVSFSDLVVCLRNTKFSLIIDESTDLSTLKYLVLLARYYDQNVQKTCDVFLTLLEMKDCTAQGLYTSIVNFFEKNNIPLENVIGFASDNALFVQGCVCHSIALCASNACTELPNSIEEVARRIYSYIMNSNKRL